MIRKRNNLKVSAPGRICLFGEHQDYLNLPVIPCAISLRINIAGKHREDTLVTLDLPDIGEKKSFSITDDLSYGEERDYFRSALNVLRREKFTFSRGLDCTVRGQIPINAGTSSSSALVVAWINFLARMSDQAVSLTPEDIAEYAHKAEVLEFREPGGMMDHYATALGGIIFLDFFPQLSYESIQTSLKSFVLGDSCESKDTKSILARVKGQVTHVCNRLSAKYPDFSLRDTDTESITRFVPALTDVDFALLQATVRNHQITLKARKVLKQKPLEQLKIGQLLNEHQRILREILKISTSKIDRMIDAALKAGAFGAKINGSGGGGCMFAYAPEEPLKVLAAIERVGGKGYVVQVDQGTHEES